MRLFEQLKAHLATLTDEEFAKEWNEIKKLNLGGPTVPEYFDYAKNNDLFQPFADYDAEVTPFSELTNTDFSLAA